MTAMRNRKQFILNKKLQEPKEPEFIVLNEYCQCFSGLRRGYPVFSDNIDEAKTLTNIEQFKKVQYGTYHTLEIHYI